MSIATRGQKGRTIVFQAPCFLSKFLLDVGGKTCPSVPQRYQEFWLPVTCVCANEKAVCLPQAETAPCSCAQTWQVGYGLGFISHLPHHGTSHGITYDLPSYTQQPLQRTRLSIREDPKELLFPTPLTQRAPLW